MKWPFVWRSDYEYQQQLNLRLVDEIRFLTKQLEAAQGNRGAMLSVYEELQRRLGPPPPSR